MAILATGSQTIIDLSDGKSLSAYLGSTQPRTQIYDVNSGTYQPNWASVAGKLVITPVVYANQTPIELTNKNLAIAWKRREGSGNETALTAGETVEGNVLTVNQNKLAGVASGLVTYIAYVTYNDPDTGLPINAAADVSFALVRTGENAKSAWISGEQVFKYAAGGAVSPAQITLTANLQNVTMGKWQYKNAQGAWTDYPTTSDNANITGTALVVKPSHACFVEQTATLRIVTSDPNIGDTTSVYKVQDGASGTAGQNASIAFLSNENITFAGNAAGQVAAVTKICNVVAYRGTAKVTPTVGEITGAPAGMTVTKGAAANAEIPISIVIAANATLGGDGVQQGVLNVPITTPVATTLHIQWSKVNTGATGAQGAAGQNAVVFSLFAPNGTVFVNGAGSLTIQTAAYVGSAPIASGATYAWEKYVGGKWEAIAEQTGATLTVAGSTVSGTASFRGKMTYGGKVYQDVITLTDKTDNYQAVIESTGGSIFKNTVGTSTLTCRLFQNGKEVDTAGTAHTYQWTRRDKDGNALDASGAWKTGKSITVTGADVDSKTTFVCEVV